MTMRRVHAGLRCSVMLVAATFGALAAAGPPAGVAEVADGARAGEPAAIVWHDVSRWGVEGRLWEEEERLRPFDRFPAVAEETVPQPVWSLSRDSAGMMVRFRTDARAIHVAVKLLRPRLAMSHMPATGVSGVDLYARDAEGRWRWVAATRPDAQEAESVFSTGLAPGSRDYAAWLPLYNGVESLSIGVPEGAAFEGLPPRGKPIVFYGTSITQGACASRPGMSSVAILGRRLDHPVANLGFSGNGRMDAAVADLLARADAACFVIDCLPNMDAALVRERCVPFVRRLRAARPGVPIVLVEDRRTTNAWIHPGRERKHADNHAALREALDILRREGIDGLWYVPSAGMLGTDDEGTVDGSHPTDLGFIRQADFFEPVLREVLGLDR
jgi:hypothetical protein